MKQHPAGSTRDSKSERLMERGAVLLVISAALVFVATILFVFVYLVVGPGLKEPHKALVHSTGEGGVLVGAGRPVTALERVRLKATSTPLPPSETPMPPTNIPQVTPTATLTAAPLTPSQTPTPPQPTATPQRVNDIPVNEFIVIPDSTIKNIVEIYFDGRRQGRDRSAFSRLGASIVDTKLFLARWDTGPYKLGPYEYLDSTIEHFRGSFSRVGAATKRGLSTWTVFNPMWADEADCRPNEHMIDCEFRLHNPTILLIFLGTNDTGSRETFEKNLRELVEYIIDKGVIPVLATKADRFEGRDDHNNKIIRKLAGEYHIPLWDFDRLAGTIPGRGLGSDKVHMTLFEQYDYTLPKAYLRGYGLFNLSALMMLDAIWDVILSSGHLDQISSLENK